MSAANGCHFMNHGRRIGVVIPARNEEQHIVDVLAGLPSMVDMAVVVNDGSTDSTGELARGVETHCKVVVIEGNGDGVGASIDRGHQHLEQWETPFISVVMAGDGQMNPDDMEALVQPILLNRADHVKGNDRFTPTDTTACQSNGNVPPPFCLGLRRWQQVNPLVTHNADTQPRHLRYSQHGNGIARGQATATPIFG